MLNLRRSLPGIFHITDDIWAREAPNRNSPGTSKLSAPCSSWKRSTGVPPLRNSRCFRSMWAGAVWQTLLTPVKIIGQSRIRRTERTAFRGRVRRRPFQHPERPLHQPHRYPWHLRCRGAHGFPVWQHLGAVHGCGQLLSVCCRTACRTAACTV